MNSPEVRDAVARMRRQTRCFKVLSTLALIGFLAALIDWSKL